MKIYKKYDMQDIKIFSNILHTMCGDCKKYLYYNVQWNFNTDHSMKVIILYNYKVILFIYC